MFCLAMHFSGRTGKESGDEQSADGDEFLGPKNGAGEEWVGEGQQEGRKEGRGGVDQCNLGSIINSDNVWQAGHFISHR